MPKTRLEQLLDIAAKDPKNAFARYGVAMELVRLDRAEEAARAFLDLARDLPDYVPTYLHAARTLEKLDRRDEARDLYARGIAAAPRAGNDHARGELETALALLG